MSESKDASLTQGNIKADGYVTGVFSQIRTLFFAYRNDHSNTPPGCLYLGMREWLEFRRNVKEGEYACFELYRSQLDHGRPEYMGMKIFIVDADRHIGVGP